MTSIINAPASTSSIVMNEDKRSGQLIIKAQLGNDIRKMMIHNEDLTLNELVLMMERIFTGKISNSDELTIKYLDDDGDKITLLNDSDLTVALHFHKLLRLFVFVNGNEQIDMNSTYKERNFIDAKIFRHELQEIRNSVQTILDRLQLPIDEVSSTTRELDGYKNIQQQQQQHSATSDNIRSNSNTQVHNESQMTLTADARPLERNKMASPMFQQAPIPTTHFLPSSFNNEQKVNAFAPPSATYGGISPIPNNATPLLPPTSTPNSNASSAISSTGTLPAGQSSNYIGQQVPPPMQQGFYAQQQVLFQQRPPIPNYNVNNTFVPQQTTSSSPATINPTFVQPAPPPMAYGNYPPQNSYYNPK